MDGVEDDRNGIHTPPETNPRKRDTDSDGITDTIEVRGLNGSNDADSDQDGLVDGLEDTNRNGFYDPTETNGRSADTDRDGLNDAAEDVNANGRVDAGETDPRRSIPTVVANRMDLRWQRIAIPSTPWTTIPTKSTVTVMD